MDSGIPDYTDVLAQLVQQGAGTDAQTTEIIMNQVASDDYNLPELLALINDRPLDFAPGRQFAYSNSNYMLLGYVIARIVGAPFGRVLTDTLLRPLGLSSARVGTQFSAANGYVLAGGQARALGRGRHMAADGELVMNVRDLARWGQAILNGQTLAPAQLQLSFQLVHGAYGMGWMHRGHIYQHGGHILGFWAGIYLDVQHGWGSGWLFNTAQQSLAADASWQKQILAWHERAATRQS
jgi:CubicO group peptidase (beta-lactamase class C family)